MYKLKKKSISYYHLTINQSLDSIPFGETCGFGVESENCKLGIDSGNLIDFDMEQEMIAEDELADISAGELSFNDGGSMKLDDSNELEKTSGLLFGNFVFKKIFSL